MPEPIVFVVASPRYGSAVMRGYQQAASVNDVGGSARTLSAVADRPSLQELRNTTVVLVKDAVVDDELVLSLSLGGNRLVWDAVDYCAHKPAVALPESPAEHLAGRAATELVPEVLSMTAATTAVVEQSFTGLRAVHAVDHQIDRRLMDAAGTSTATDFDVVYFGAPENLPAWADAVPSIRRLLTSVDAFDALVPQARRAPVHADIRNPLRDRRNHKPWTKVATTLALGALPIAENTDANVAALGDGHPFLFDGSLVDFERVLGVAEERWHAGELAPLFASLASLRERSDPHHAARRLLDLLR
jgi:hypothetical protein